MQAPLQPTNWESVAGTAVSVSVGLPLYRSTQSVPQSMPGKEEVTVPLPVPVSVTPSMGAHGPRL